MKRREVEAPIMKLVAMSELERRLMVKSFLLSFYVTLLVRFSEFQSILRLVRNDGGAGPNVALEFCEQAERATRRGWRLSPLRGRCLELAMTLIIILHDEGVSADLRLGVDPDLDKFAAHAWVEVPECGYVGSFGNGWVSVATLR